MFKNIWRKLLCVVLGLSLLSYSFVLWGLYHYQETLIFPALPLSQHYKFNFKEPFEELSIPVEGGKLNALHFKQPDPKGLVFFLHGNGGNLKNWATGADFYQRTNYDMFIFDYRGYGKSSGRIQSQGQLHADVQLAWDFIVPKYAGKPIVIFGRSLGTGLAVELARKENPELLVLVSPFTSMVALAQAQFPLAPSWALRYPFRTDKLISDVRSRTVLIHGSEDNLIPMFHSEKLFSLLQAPSKLLIVEGAGHNNIHKFASYLNSLAAELPE